MNSTLPLMLELLGDKWMSCLSLENNRFDGQHVVLFNTFNSNFGDDQIAEFKAKVMAHGASSFEHKYVLRGRMTQQLTPEQMLRAIDEGWFRAQMTINNNYRF
ncbi:hypothetical protein [Oceanobacter kriegii]|uniref:hypothetical protein n=1 Tax=Oceanobacter kriegii TaxID=64972 RepID=UPI0012EBCBF8|nr:hypothetical protein [Oceanobacter kriegii]